MWTKILTLQYKNYVFTACFNDKHTYQGYCLLGWFRVTWYMVTNVSEEPPASVLRAEEANSSNRWYLCTKLHGVTFQKTVIFLLTAVGIPEHDIWPAEFVCKVHFVIRCCTYCFGKHVYRTDLCTYDSVCFWVVRWASPYNIQHSVVFVLPVRCIEVRVCIRKVLRPVALHGFS
jgi:hypothetical protein